jgi:hypothetical protein
MFVNPYINSQLAFSMLTRQETCTYLPLFRFPSLTNQGQKSAKFSQPIPAANLSPAFQQAYRVDQTPYRSVASADSRQAPHD